MRGMALQVYRKVLVVLPFVALVQEKAEHLQAALASMKCGVKGYSGNDDAGNNTPLAERWAPPSATAILIWS